MRIRTPNIPFEVAGKTGLFLSTHVTPVEAELNLLEINSDVYVYLGENQVAVKLKKIVGEMCEGIVIKHPDNETLHGVRLGDLLRFQKKNIFQIHTNSNNHVKQQNHQPEPESGSRR